MDIKGQLQELPLPKAMDSVGCDPCGRPKLMTLEKTSPLQMKNLKN